MNKSNPNINKWLYYIYVTALKRKIRIYAKSQGEGNYTVYALDGVLQWHSRVWLQYNKGRGDEDGQ